MTANKTVTATYTGNNRLLTIVSSNPSSGVSITVSPNDKGGQANGPTQLLRTYDLATAVTLTAPTTVGSNNFNAWTGCDTTVGTTCHVTMNADRSVTVGYLSPNPLTIVTASLPASRVSVTYPDDGPGPVTFTATGGTGNYTWSLAGGTQLPRGLSLSSNGTISGVPIELGTSKVSVQVSDGNSDPVVASYLITIQTSPYDGSGNNGGFTKPFAGYWSFDDGTAFDDSGSRAHGTPMGGPTVVPIGKIGQALRFDGTSQYIDFGNVLDAGTGSLSVFAWVRTNQITQPGGSNILISKFNSSGGYRLFQNSSGGLSFAFSNGSNTVRADSTTLINDNNWHWVGAVFTRSANGVIYVDGAPVASANISSMNGNFVGNTTSLLFALGDQTNQGLFWKGDIDEVQIVTRRAFTDPEVADMYNPHPSIVSKSLPDATVGSQYKQTLKGSGGTLPYTWSLAPGSSLPPGFSPLSQTGTIEGTPTVAGPYSFNVILDDPSNAVPATQTVNLIVRGTSKQLLTENFNDLTNWTKVDPPNPDNGPSFWYVSGGDLIQKNETQAGYALDEDGVFAFDPAKPGTYRFYNGDTSTWKDYDLSLRIMAESIQAIGVMFRYIDLNNFYRFSMDYRRHYQMLVKVVNGQTSILQLDMSHTPFDHGQSYDLRVALSGNNIQVFLDNNPIPTFNVTDSSFSQGTVALYCWGDVNCHYGNVQVTCTTERDPQTCSAAH